MSYFGILATLVWLSLFGALLCFKWDEAVVMPLNAWGDLFAGVMAPVAFLWLILGYHLQRKELQQNTAALKEQARELQEQKRELQEQNENMVKNYNATKELADAVSDAASNIVCAMIHT